MVKTPDGQWGQHHLAALLGTKGPHFGRYLNGVDYPTFAMMQKFEVVFGWPVVEQVQLIPYLWEEKDMRYAMVLHQHIVDWAQENPRTLSLKELRMDPRLESRHNTKKTPYHKPRGPVLVKRK